MYAAGRDEEELRDTLTTIAKLATRVPSFLLKFSDEFEDKDAASGVDVYVPRGLARAGDASVVQLLERVFTAPCGDATDEFSSDAASALVALAK